MAGHSIGTVYVELDLDPSRYTKGQQQLLRDATTTSLNIEKNFKNLGIKSSAEMDLMRAKITNSFNMIANNSRATANDIVRAEEAKNAKLKALNEQQYGHQTSMLESLKKNWMAVSVAIYASMRLIRGAWDLAEQSAKFEQQRAALNNLATSYGTTADRILSELRNVSDGTINTMTLVEKAGTAMMMGITPDKVTKLMEIARATARMTGQEVSQAFSDISLAVGRQSKMILDNLGIIVSVENANKAYAESVGKTATQLTDADKKMAFMNATVKAGEELIARLGTQTDTTRDKMERFRATIDDLKLTAGTVLIRAFSGVAALFETVAASALIVSGGIFKIIQGVTSLTDVLKITTNAADEWKIASQAAFAGGAELWNKAKEKFSLMFAPSKELTGVPRFLPSPETLNKEIGATEDKLKDFYEKLDAMRISMIKDQTNRELEEETLKTKKLLEEAEKLGVSKSYILHMSEEAQQLIREKGYERERKLQDEQKAGTLQLEKDLFQIRVGADNEYGKQELIRMTLSIDLANLEADKKTAIFNKSENERIQILEVYAAKEVAIIQKATAESIRIKEYGREAEITRGFDERQKELDDIWAVKWANAAEGVKVTADLAKEYYTLTGNIEELVKIQRQETEDTIRSAQAKGYLTDEMRKQMEYIGEVKVLEIKLAPFKIMIDEIGSLWGNVFANMASGTKSFSETFQESMKSLQAAFIQMVTQMIAKWLMFQAITGIFGGKTASALGMTNPLPFAEGGVVTSPTVALAGEVPEAFVPLKSGKIPVEMKAPASQGNLTINIPISIDSRNKKLETELKREMESTALRVIQRHM